MDASTDITPDPKVDAIIANINELMAEAEQMLNDSSSQHAEEQVDLLRTRCDTLRTHLAATWASAGRTMAEGVRHSDRVIRANPYRALAIALGAGLVAGVLLGRKSE